MTLLARALAVGSRMPWLASLARRRSPEPAVPHELGTVYRAEAPTALVVVAGPAPDALGWLAGALAAGASAAALVPPADVATDASALDDLVTRACAAFGVPTGRVVLVGESEGADAVLQTAAMRAERGAGVARVVLVTPLTAPDPLPGTLPPVWVQGDPDDASVRASRTVELELREAGVPARSVELAGAAPGWVRAPRALRHSDDHLAGVVTFVAAGLST